jgi:hypothetical protein
MLAQLRPTAVALMGVAVRVRAEPRMVASTPALLATDR